MHDRSVTWSLSSRDAGLRRPPTQCASREVRLLVTAEVAAPPAHVVVREVQEPAKAVGGGFSILDVPSHAAALEWAAELAVGCRWAQEVRELMVDPEL